MAGRKLFDWQDTLSRFADALNKGVDVAIFTHISNVFGYILPVEELAALCRARGVPFIVDAAQSAGCLDVKLQKWGADFVAMPGHKGLLGPQGTGILLCGRKGVPLLAGGTGSDSIIQEMPQYLPDRLEAGTVNVPGIAGLNAGLQAVKRMGIHSIFDREAKCTVLAAKSLEKLGYQLFSGPHQGGTISFVPAMDCEEFARLMARRGVALRSGLHCAPLAHESAGTLETGTVRISFGHDATYDQVATLERALAALCKTADF